MRIDLLPPPVYDGAKTGVLFRDAATSLSDRRPTLEELTDLSKERSEMEKLAHQLFRDHKKVLDLITKQSPDLGFEPALRRLFGDNPKGEKPVRIGNRYFVYSEFKKNLVSFLPERWQDELVKTTDGWPGCENWWAGYPLITWVEIRPGDDQANGYLTLNAEVGPISNHKLRKGAIETIKAGASAKGLKRIQFQIGASDKGRLYSRFLQKNSVPLNDIHNTDEIERKFVQLIVDFESEFDLVASVISEFPRVEKER